MEAKNNNERLFLFYLSEDRVGLNYGTQEITVVENRKKKIATDLDFKLNALGKSKIEFWYN